MTVASPGIADRVLAWVGGDDPATLGSKFFWFRRYVLLHLAVEAWFRYTLELPRQASDFSFALLYTLCLALGWWRRWTRSAGEICLIVVLAQIAWWFPHTANHLYLEGLIVLVVALFDPERPAECTAALRGLRWLPLLVLFYSGVKKLVYGFYFDASFFGQMISIDRRFLGFFRPLLEADELKRLARLGWPAAAGAGPYRIDSLPIQLMSNLVWACEILFSLGLLLPKLRRAAAVGCVLLVIGIEIAAREVFFGALFINLLLLYAARDLNRRLFPLFVAFLLWMTLIMFELVPRWGLV